MSLYRGLVCHIRCVAIKSKQLLNKLIRFIDTFSLSVPLGVVSNIGPKSMHRSVIQKFVESVYHLGTFGKLVFNNIRFWCALNHIDYLIVCIVWGCSRTQCSPFHFMLLTHSDQNDNLHICRSVRIYRKTLDWSLYRLSRAWPLDYSQWHIFHFQSISYSSISRERQEYCVCDVLNVCGSHRKLFLSLSLRAICWVIFE